MAAILNTPTKLRDFIRSIRSCKTAQEERSLIQKEKALIRESFVNQENDYKARNVAKLLFINMLGHDTDFGQMECLNLITSSQFTEKRIGYLGLTQLFHEKSEVLMMATNRLQQDLDSNSNYIVSLALVAMSEVCTPEMTRELKTHVQKVIKIGTSFVKKKAALAASKVVKQIPDCIEEFLDKIDILMEDRHHGVLLSTLGLIEDIITTAPKYKEKFKKYFTSEIKILKGLVSSYSAEFDINGISDPFLQIQILKFLRLMAEDNQQLSEELSDVLAQVANSTSSSKSTGFAVLYECVKTIMSIQSSSTLKTMGINTLSKFLTHKDPNSKYVSLNMLKKVLNYDINTVQKHKQLIMDCLKENDISIKLQALDLTYLISNETNVKDVIKELLNHLLDNSNVEFLPELTTKICAIVDKHSPNRRWHIDTIIKVLTIAGCYVKEDSICNLIHLICITPQLQSYAVSKLYFSLCENQNQEGLTLAALYCIGEFGQLLISGKTQTINDQPIKVQESEVVDLAKKIFDKIGVSYTAKEYGLTCLIKLYTKFPSQHQRITEIFKSETTSHSAEVQKRACEYLQLIGSDWNQDLTSICDTIPQFKSAIQSYTNKPIGELAGGDTSIQLSELHQSDPKKQQQQQQTLIDVDDLIGSSATNNALQQKNLIQNDKNSNGIDLLTEVFGSSTISQVSGSVISQQQQQQQQQEQKQQQQQQQQQPINLQNKTSDIDLLGLNFAQPNEMSQAQPQVKVTQNKERIEAYQDNYIEVVFDCLNEGTNTTINIQFRNKTQQQINDLLFQAAVQKHLSITINPISSTFIKPNSYSSQKIVVANTLQGQKTIALKIKLAFKINTEQINQEFIIKKFPQNW